MTAATSGWRRVGPRWAALAFAAVAVAALWSPMKGLRPLSISDASEYAISAARLVEGKGFTIRIDGKVHPPRYPWGFPVAFLAPVYAIAGTTELGRGLVAVIASGVAVLLLLRGLCRRSLPPDRAELGAWATLAAVLALRAFRQTAGWIMSDLPLLLTCIVACAAFGRAWVEKSTRWFWIGGAAAALAISIRLTSLAFVLPFAWLAWRRRRERGLAPLAASLAPVALAWLGLGVYNAVTFGSPFFTGYDYWLWADPGFLSLRASGFGRGLFAFLLPFTPPMFGGREGALWSPIGATVSLLLVVPAIPGVLCRLRCPDVWERTRPIGVFLVLGALPITLFHLFFPANSRYHLPFHVLWLTLGCVWAAALVPPRLRKAAYAIVAVAVTAVLLAFPPWARYGQGDPEGARIAMLDAAVPDDGVLVGSLSGVLADRLFVGETGRRFVPLNPFAPYASFLVGAAGQEHQRSYDFTGWNADRIDAFFRHGRRVFYLREASVDAGQFERRYALVPKEGAPGELAELHPAWRPAVRVDFGGDDPAGEAALREGWHPRHWRHPFGRFRFGLGSRSTIVLPLSADGPVLLQAVLGPSPSGHQDVTITANGRDMASFELEPKFRQYSWVLPAGWVRGKDELRLALERRGLGLAPADQLDPYNPANLGPAILWLSLATCPGGDCPGAP